MMGPLDLDSAGVLDFVRSAAGAGSPAPIEAGGRGSGMFKSRSANNLLLGSAGEDLRLLDRFVAAACFGGWRERMPAAARPPLHRALHHTAAPHAPARPSRFLHARRAPVCR